MFILPKKILKEVNNVCRAYLWHGDASTVTPGNVSWDKVCFPKNSSGLGIRNLESWNLAAVGKIDLHISMKHDWLWVKLIREVYMKGGQMENLQSTYNLKLGFQENMSCERKAMCLDGTQQICYK